MSKTLSVLVAGLAMMANSFAALSDYPSAWNCDGENARFAWYCEPQAKPEKPETPIPVEPKPRRIQEMATVKEAREELERLQDVAIMNPTEEHIKTYVEAQEWMMQKGGAFADAWQRVLWANPGLDYSLKRPTSMVARQAYNQTRTQETRMSVEQAAYSNGIFFFFRSDCPYCHKFAPILRRFAQLHNFEVFAVSLDGGPIPDFPDARPNNGIAEKLSVETVPAVYLASKQTGNIQPLGYGVLTVSELTERIETLALPLGQRY